MSVEIYRTLKQPVTCGAIDDRDGVVACLSYHHSVKMHLNFCRLQDGQLVLVYNLLVKSWNRIAFKQNVILSSLQS